MCICVTAKNSETRRVNITKKAFDKIAEDLNEALAIVQNDAAGMKPDQWEAKILWYLSEDWGFQSRSIASFVIGEQSASITRGMTKDLRRMERAG
jgi:hypothetical protein